MSTIPIAKSETGGERPRRLVGKVAAVTGAGQGIGRAIARRLAREGASVFASDLDSELLHALETELAGAGHTLAAEVFDAFKVTDAARHAKAVVERFGRIDILVNNAGGVRPQPFPEVTEETWDWNVTLNMKGPFFYMQEAAKRMIEQRSGAIVNLASQAGLAGPGTLSPPYAASKAAVINFTKVAAASLAEYGITVNAVAPGIVDTSFNWTIDEDVGVKEWGLAPGGYLKMRSEAVPLGRLQKPEDIANAVAFLVSPDASEITGETVVVTGGQLMR